MFGVWGIESRDSGNGAGCRAWGSGSALTDIAYDSLLCYGALDPTPKH